MDSLRRFWDAVEAFVDALGAVALGPLLLAVAFHVANLVLRTRGWRNILGAAYPDADVRWPPVFGAYTAGVGVNSVIPARLGDVVKLLLVHRSVPGSTYPTLTASLLAETVFDMVMGSAILLWALTFGITPELPDLPNLPIFEFSWMARHPLITGVGVILALAALGVWLIIAQHRIRAFWARVEQGLAILRTPRVYGRTVVTYQAAGWVCRAITAYFFLRAFHIDATLRNALLIMVVQAVATVMPFTPGGVGPKQALLVVVLAGQAGEADVLALSVGMEIAIVATNVAVGAASLAVLFRGSGGIRGAIAEA
ncbi:MAG: lysylphosphatidylglycerol synthase transmembrane domain-containing protein, partial [Actinomycetota bacterium]